VAEHGTLFVVSAPSGAGKRTVLNEVFQEDPTLAYSVSATTRPPRRGEVDGKDYIFLERREFLRRIETGEFLEWAEVHGNLYGTLRAPLRELLASGKDIILELDVQGMRRVRMLEDGVVTVFIAPPTFEVLEERLKRRGANGPDDMARRLEDARTEMAQQDEFDYVVVNDKLEDAVAEFEGIVGRHRRAPRAS